MKNVCLKIGLIALALALVFGVALIVLTVNREYAKLHYRQNHTVTMNTWHTYGCGDASCKYCSGQTSTYRKSFGYENAEKSFSQFLYYRIVTGFWVASIVLTSISGATAAVMIPLHYKRRKTRRSDREDY